MLKRVITLVGILTLTFTWCSPSYVTSSGLRRVKVAVFPFNDFSSMNIDMAMTSVLRAELATWDFIDTVSLEIVKRRITEVEPTFLWTEKKDSEKRGAILWKIEPRIVEEVARRIDADFVVSGDISRFNTKWRINAYVSERNNKTIQVFNLSGDKGEEIPAKLGKMAKEIALLLRKETVVGEAEEEIRKFLGGIYTLSVVVAKIERLSQSFQDSLPIHALLLDLYLRDKASYREKIFDIGSKVIGLYNPSNDADTRYLLSLSLDPFEVIARVYEEKEEWRKAIELREKALRVFPFYAANHRAGIGSAAYTLATTYERRGEKEKAIEYYRKALPYLPPTSEELSVTKERLDILDKK